ncbi:MAG: hypothetical protein OXQ94_04040 [Gemmatimonadota bacterium]|nr:hypothetical protein [Gemmatimonadota bacterium]MDE2870844.1 hypothetical protein [Gemmatimonadota bacterium]
MTNDSTMNNHHAAGRVLKGLVGFAFILMLNPGPEAAGQIPGSGVWDLHPEQRWQVTESLRIGEGRGEGPAAFGFAQCVAVDPLDRIWVTDGFAHELRVFEADGSHVRTVRKLPEGAGEFQIIGEAFPGPGDRIWVEERSLRRYQIFDTAGTWVGSQEFILPEAPEATRAWTRQGLMVAREVFDQEVDTIRFYELADGALRETDRKRTWPAQRMSTHVVTVGAPEGKLSVSFLEAIPFATQPSGFFGSDLDLWTARGDGPNRYEIRRTSLETDDDLLSITQGYEPVRVPDAVRRAAADSLVELHTSTGNRLLSEIHWRKLPNRYPAYESLHVSAGGEIWVRRVLAAGRFGFDVFAPDGQYLGQPEVPQDLGLMSIRVIKGNSIYAIRTNADGLDQIVRFDVAGMGETRAATGFLAGCLEF